MSSLFKVVAATHTITPWRTWDEWTACKAGLHATLAPEEATPEACALLQQQRQKALHTVNAWRGRGRVPLAVESTAQIMELNMRHQYPPQAGVATAAGTGSASTLQSRLEYSMALLRLVNGVLDPMQAKQHAQSVNSLAKQMQMPRMLVDLRHESTHQGLPSLPLLQLASLAALDWLQRHYWTAQSHAISKVDDAVRHQLKEYKKGLERSKPKKKDAEEDAEEEISVAVHSGDSIMMLESHQSGVGSAAGMPEKSQEALRTLFSTITSGHSLQHTHTTVETKLIPALLSENFLIKPPKQSRVSLPQVFRRLLETWDPALFFLAHKWKSQALPFYQLIFVRIVRTLSRAPADNKAGASWTFDLLREWAMHLLRTQAAVIFKEDSAASAADASAASKKRGHSAMQEGATHTSVLDDVMHRCLKSLNPWLASLLPLLLPIFKQQHGQSRPQAVAQLELLLHLTTKSLYPQYRVAAPSQLKLDSHATPNMQSSIQTFLEKHRTAANSAIAASPAASTSDAIELVRDFALLPIGSVPNQDAESLWLADEDWLSSADIAAAAASVVAAPVAAAALVVAAVPSSDSAEAMQIESEETTEVTAVAAAQERPAKRARASPAVHAPVATSEKALLARSNAIQRLQQAIVWM